MSGIRTEGAIFLCALLAGIQSFLAYRILMAVRSLFRHPVWLVNAEDFLFWLATSIFIFRKMYETTYGEVRFYYLVGIVCGAATAYMLVRFLRYVCCKRHWFILHHS